MKILDTFRAPDGLDVTIEHDGRREVLHFQQPPKGDVEAACEAVLAARPVMNPEDERQRKLAEIERLEAEAARLRAELEAEDEKGK